MCSVLSNITYGFFFCKQITLAFNFWFSHSMRGKTDAVRTVLFPHMSDALMPKSREL